MQVFSKELQLQKIKNCIDDGAVPPPSFWAKLPCGEEEGFVYRAIHEKEDVTLGLAASKPKRGMTVTGHVRHGSTHKGSQFISTTRDLWFAIFFALAENRKICKIDLSQVRGDIITLDTTEKAKLHVTNEIARRYAVAASEVLLQAYVPPSAIVAVFELKKLPTQLSRTAKFLKWKHMQVNAGKSAADLITTIEDRTPAQPTALVQPATLAQTSPPPPPPPSATETPVAVDKKPAVVVIAFQDWRGVWSRLPRAKEREARAAPFTLLNGKYRGSTARLQQLNGSNVKLSVESQADTIYWMRVTDTIGLSQDVFNAATTILAA